MQIRAEKLRNDLKKRQLPMYLLCGEEPLQHKETLDMLRKAAHYYGYTDREVYTAETGFDWDTLLNSANTLSLFAGKRLLELFLPSGKPGDKGGKALLSYCEHPPEDTMLLIVIAGKLDAAAKKSRWYKALDKTGGIIQVWPIEGQQLNGWLNRRLQAKGLKLPQEAVQLINDRVEGNLLAADQEIEKLSLLFSACPEPADSPELIGNSPEQQTDKQP